MSQKKRKVDEFWRSIEAYQKISSLGTANEEGLNLAKAEVAKLYNDGLNFYCRSDKRIERRPKLHQFLSKFISLMPSLIDFLKTHGAELLKLTFDAQDFDYQQKDLHNFDICTSKIEDVNKEIESTGIEGNFKQRAEINIMASYICQQIIAIAPEKETILHLAGVLYGQHSEVAKIARIILSFGDLFDRVKKKRQKYLQAALFTLGGLLKNEVKSVISHLFPDRNISADEGVQLRNLTGEDLSFFENRMHSCFTLFLSKLLSYEKLPKSINKDNTQYLIDMMQTEFADKYEQEKHNNADQLELVESTHCILCFLFDCLQFYFEFLTNIKKVDVEKKDKQWKITVNFEYVLKDSAKIIGFIAESIHKICQNFFYLYDVWNTKRFELVTEEKTIEERDGYLRTDNYNSIGISILYYLNYCHYRDQKQQPEREEKWHNILQSPFKTAYLFELSIPLMNALLESKENPQLLTAFTIDLLSSFCGTIAEQEISDIGAYLNTKKETLKCLAKVFDFIGGQAEESLRKSVLDIFWTIIKFYNLSARLTLYEELLDSIDHDKAKSLLLSSYQSTLNEVLRTDWESNDALKAFINSDRMKVVLYKHLDSTSYILDISETLVSALNLYRYLLIVDQNLGGKLHIADKSTRTSITADRIEPIIKIATNMIPTFEKETEEYKESNKPVLEAAEDEVREQMLFPIESRAGRLQLILGLISRIEEIESNIK